MKNENLFAALRAAFPPDLDAPAVEHPSVRPGPWLLGETFSAADIMIESGLNFAIKLFKMVPTRPSFDRYIEKCSARPAFQRAAAIAAG